jgi:ribonuclease HI
MKITAYSDGACSGNPGPGGWASIITNEFRTKVLTGFDRDTTNNRMELIAVLETMKYFEHNIVKHDRNSKTKLDIYSDSAYVVYAIKKEWLKKWAQNNFVKTDGHPVQNVDLWKQVHDLVKHYNIHMIKVKGHDGNPQNEKADKLAKNEIVKFRRSEMEA